jgi:Domain of unknown function (DUF932)
MNLFEAHNQWRVRPLDERFWGIDDALAASQYIKNHSREMSSVPYAEVKVEPTGGELALTTADGVRYGLLNSSTQQLCQRARVPHSLVARQPAELAARNINWGIEAHRKEESDNCELLIYRGSTEMVRAITSERYERLWSADYLATLLPIFGNEWRVPPARPVPDRIDPRARQAVASDILGIESLTSIRVGDVLAPASVYLGDRDMFAFVVSRKTINGPSGPLCRFALFWNNEIGTGSFGMTLGYFDHVCGNHIIWGAQGVREFRVRHIGECTVRASARQISKELGDYAESSSKGDEALLKRAGDFKLGDSREEAIAKVINMGRIKRVPELTERRVSDAYDLAATVERYGSPRNAWAIVSGLTELSQSAKYGNERFALDRAAAKVLEMVP